MFTLLRHILNLSKYRNIFINISMTSPQPPAIHCCGSLKLEIFDTTSQTTVEMGRRCVNTNLLFKFFNEVIKNRPQFNCPIFSLLIFGSCVIAIFVLRYLKGFGAQNPWLLFSLKLVLQSLRSWYFLFHFSYSQYYFSPVKKKKSEKSTLGKFCTDKITT